LAIPRREGWDACLRELRRETLHLSGVSGGGNEGSRAHKLPNGEKLGGGKRQAKKKGRILVAWKEEGERAQGCGGTGSKTLSTRWVDLYENLRGNESDTR